MAYFLIIPISFKILIYFTMQGGSLPFIFIKDFYNWIFTIFVISGIFYTIPVFFVILVHIGVLPIKYLRGRNKFFAYLGILLVFWIFGPDPTPITGLIMLAPFIVVFETATYFAGRIDKAREMKKVAQGLVAPKGPPRGFVFVSMRACRFCNSPIDEKTLFCPRCKRSLR